MASPLPPHLFLKRGSGTYVTSVANLNLNPHLTTGYAVEILKYFNVQPRGVQSWLECVVASELSMEEAPTVQEWSRSRRREAWSLL
jgi:hypothetical protein